MGVIRAAIKAENTKVVEAVARSAHYLGIGMANCLSIFNPEMVIVGGGLVEKLGAWYLGIAEQSMRDHALRQLSEHVSVKQCQLGDNAVAIGAICLLRDSL